MLPYMSLLSVSYTHLIVGGGRIAAHKAEKVKPFGAKITIIAPDIMDKLKQDPAFMCEERPLSLIHI